MKWLNSLLSTWKRWKLSRGNLKSFPSYLRSTEESSLQFFNFMTLRHRTLQKEEGKWVGLGVEPVADQGVENQQGQCCNTHVLYINIMCIIMYFIVFKIILMFLPFPSPSLSPSLPLRSRPCTSSQLFHFGWILYIHIKSK